jgi:hypothetical protein
MMLTVGGELERDTLAAWAGQVPLLELAGLYDVFRDGLTDAHERYRIARCRGRRGDGDAGEALAEVVDLVALLDVLADEFTYRRGWYLHVGRLWPLGSRLW